MDVTPAGMMKPPEKVAGYLIRAVKILSKRTPSILA